MAENNSSTKEEVSNSARETISTRFCLTNTSQSWPQHTIFKKIFKIRHNIVPKLRFRVVISNQGNNVVCQNI